VKKKKQKQKKQAFDSFCNAVSAAPEAYHGCTDLECIKPPKNMVALVAKKILYRRRYFKILYMSCNHLQENGRE